jgi:hypothetical protein
LDRPLRQVQLAEVLLVTFHSWRSAISGSTFVAQRAGR